MKPGGSVQCKEREIPVSVAFREMVARAMRGLARPGAENSSDRGENEQNWPRKARSVISDVISGAMLRLTCYSSARGSKSARVDARGCIEAVAEDEKKDGLERTGPELVGELIYGSGRGGAARRLEGSVRSSPLHPSVKLLDVEVGKSDGTPRSTIRARAVAWAWTKLQSARWKMKVKAVCYKASNPIKEEDRNEEEDGEEEEEEDNLVLADEEEEGGKVELSKKRILMGRRCKPLNCSGTLQYDHNGILLPESLP